MLKLHSGGKYAGTVREYKPKKYTGGNLVKREKSTGQDEVKHYTFNLKGKGTITFKADSLEEARRIAKEMKASVRTGRLK